MSMSLAIDKKIKEKKKTSYVPASACQILRLSTHGATASRGLHIYKRGQSATLVTTCTCAPAVFPAVCFVDAITKVISKCFRARDWEKKANIFQRVPLRERRNSGWCLFLFFKIRLSESTPLPTFL